MDQPKYLSQFKQLHMASNNLRATAVVDDDFPEMMHKFDTIRESINRLPIMPRIICLCGSTKFKEAFIKANFDYTMKGHIVLSVGWFSHADKDQYFPSDVEKSGLDELHKRKIDLADGIFVINVGGYIGESTKSEIDYARSTGKHIKYLEV